MLATASTGTGGTDAIIQAVARAEILGAIDLNISKLSRRSTQGNTTSVLFGTDTLRNFKKPFETLES